ncbi:MAG TPA: hypothetical protein VL484_09170 [Vicinamibacterales bacterium]|jgi:hypothetical protein|nr:hypothetical protein [Vicinamibacterales bacterium]
MNGRDSMQSLLVRRKLTRAIAEIARAQMTEHLATLAPLLRPRAVLGDYVDDGAKESTRRSDKAFKELQALYENLASTKPFNLPRELSLPLRLTGSGGLEITPVDTAYTIPSGSDVRTIMVRSPLTWTLTYSGYSPTRLPELIKSKLRAGEELAHVVISYLLLHVVVTNSPGLMHVFEALHFPITTTTTAEFGPLPITRIGPAIATTRPPDDVILQSAELTGMDAFEEVVNADDLSRLGDPFRDRLLEIARQA